MNKRILSIFCAIAMFVTMMSSFVITVNAEETPTITFTALNTAKKVGDDITFDITYSGFADDVTIKGMEVTIPLNDNFTFKSCEVAQDMVDYNAYDLNGEKGVAIAGVALKEKDYVKAPSGKLATLTLTLAKATGETVDVAGVDGLFTIATGPVNMTIVPAKVQLGDKPAVTAPPVPPEETTDKPFIKVKALNQPAQAGDVVDLEITYGQLAEGMKIKGMEFNIIFNDKFDYVPDSCEVAFDMVDFNAYELNGVKGLAIAGVALKEKDYVTETSGKIATLKVKVSETAEWAEQINVKAEEIVLTTDPATPEIVALPATIVVGAGYVDSSVKLTVDEKAVSLEPKATATVAYTVDPADAKVTVASSDTKVATATAKNGKITITAVADGSATITVTAVSGEDTATAEIAVTVASKEYVEAKAEPTVVELPGGSKTTYYSATFSDEAAAQIEAQVKDTETYILVFSGKKGNELVASTALELGGELFMKVVKGEAKAQTSINGADSVKCDIFNSKYEPMEVK